MTERCLTIGCPDAVRVSLQDVCSGVPSAGECNGYVISCIRNWSIAPIVREGDSSEFASDCGSMVNRDRQDDQLLGYTISFETAIRSNELEALVTGKEVIDSGGLGIGTYGVGSALTCTNPSSDPRFIIEAFYKLSNCTDGANHVRWVLPMAQFKVTELDKEGTVTYYRYTAETGISLARAIGSGPFLDFPSDITSFISSLDPAEYTTGFDFEESITISGQCGCVSVPDQEQEVIPIIIGIEMDCPDGNIVITGTDLDLVLGWFEFENICGIVRGYISSSTCNAGSQAISESPTEVIIENPGFGYGCDCPITNVTIYDGDCNEISSTAVDPEVNVCCDEVSVVGFGSCDNVDNYITDAFSPVTLNLTMNGVFPDFALFSQIILNFTVGSSTYFPSDPEIAVLSATQIQINDLANGGKVLVSVQIDGAPDQMNCTINPHVYIYT